VIRLKEGEASILGGILEKQETKTISGLPGLGEIPLLKYLFSSQQHEVVDDEIVFVLIPHIVRATQINAMNLRTLDSGTGQTVEIRHVAKVVDEDETDNTTATPPPAQQQAVPLPAARNPQPAPLPAPPVAAPPARPIASAPAQPTAAPAPAPAAPTAAPTSGTVPAPQVVAPAATAPTIPTAATAVSQASTAAPASGSAPAQPTAPAAQTKPVTPVKILPALTPAEMAAAQNPSTALPPVPKGIVVRPPQTASSTPPAPINFTMIPPQSTQALKSTFQIAINLTAGQDVYSVPLQVQYDKDLLALVNVDSGNLLGKDGQAISVVHRDDGNGGLAIVVARPPGTNGVDGSGTVCVLTFQAKAAGDALLKITRVTAMNSGQQQIPSKGSDALVHIK
jgi:general secretion pathway protein D